MLDGKTVLVVDDEPTVLRIYSAAIEKAGARVVTAQNGSDGLAQARAERPDLILSDIMMPRKDGLQLLTEIRADPELAQTPLILISAYTDPRLKTQAEGLGADEVLVKGIALKDLVGAVRLRLAVDDRA